MTINGINEHLNKKNPSTSKTNTPCKLKGVFIVLNSLIV